MKTSAAWDLRRVRLVEANNERLSWAEGLTLSLPVDLLEGPLSGRVAASGDLRLPADLPGMPRSAADGLRERAAFTEIGPVSSRVPLSYRHVPSPIRRVVGRAVGRWSRRAVDSWATFPGWPIDLSADFLADLAGDHARPPGPTPVCLTHDIDSAEGLSNLVAKFLALEERAGARSTNFIVPCDWPLDARALDEVVARGHELGIHGYDHSQRTPFAPDREMHERIEAARHLRDRYHMRGYRAPALLRTRRLVAALPALYAYDSSIPTSGGRFPVANNGCASARPFRIGPLLEIPLSLPRDGSLRFLGYRPVEILPLWIDIGRLIARSGGVVVLLTHCERGFSGNRAMLDVYARFLDAIAEDRRFCWSTLSEVGR